MKPSILIVDDETSFRSVLVELLTEAGYVVAGASSGEEALSMLDQRRYEIIFSDLRMPGIDGITLLREVKKRDASIEVIMVTSHTSVSSAIEALRLGSYDYLIKPLDEIEQVLAIVKRVSDKLTLEQEKKKLLEDLQNKNRELEESEKKIFQFSVDIAALYAAEKEILAGLDLGEVYQRSVTALSKLVDLRPSRLWVPSESGENLLLQAYSGIEEIDPKEWTIRFSDPLPSHREIPKEWGEAFLAKMEIDAVLFQPILGHENKMFGLLAIFDRGKRAFTKREEDILSRFSSSVALAIENATLYERVKHLAIRDGLTGLYNRRHFEETLKQETVRAHRHKQPISLIFIDVDHFKNYNDGHGHRAGDEILKKVGSLIVGRVRGIDTACRYGGEEFTVILPYTEKASAWKVAEEIRSKIGSYPFPFREHQPGGAVTVSLGVAEYPADGETEEALVKAADSALYRAKQDGRNRVSDCPRELPIR
ncbi:MAG: diguanylate cyclase [Candidatus Manganitrophaceae bacterium]